MSRTNKGNFNLDTMPDTIKSYLTHSVLSDASGHSGASTIYIEGDIQAYLKINGRGKLERERRMLEFLGQFQLAPQVIAYASDQEHDYLLTEALPGEDGSSAYHKDRPDQLAVTFGESLRLLHSLPTEGCPYPNRTEEMLIRESRQNHSPDVIEKVRNLAVDEVLIHGDYCLPNVMFHQFKLQGFLDVGDGGIGDRHYDLYWGLWTLTYNLKTDQYHDRFLDAYGRDTIDRERLEWFTRWMDESRRSSQG